MNTPNNNQTINRRNSITEKALEYASIGLSVMPLGPISKDSSGKKVIGWPPDWKRYQTKIASPEEIRLWNYKNLGIITGQISGLLVLDSDSYKEGFNHELLKSFNLPITPVQKTASGGNQYFFKLPKDVVIKNDVCIGTKGSGIDIRGDGGMVIVPPSTTPYGQYEWVLSPFDTPLADIPPKLLSLLMEKAGGEFKTKKTLPELVCIEDGKGRNNSIASFTGKLLPIVHEDKWDEEIWPMVQAVNKTYNPPLQDEELLSIYESITKREYDSKSKTTTSKEKTTEVTLYLPAISHAELMAKEFPKARYTLEPFFEQGMHWVMLQLTVDCSLKTNEKLEKE